MYDTSFPLILAHAGGGALAPNNTLAAFQRGLEAGADGFELDVHLSKDGIPVVTHDFSLERVAGIPAPVASLTASELQKLDAGSWFSPEFSDQYIPTLEEVLALAAGKSAGKTLTINIELKAGYRLYPRIEEKCLGLAETILRDSTVIFSSFDHYALRHIKDLDQNAITGGLHECSLINAHDYAATHGMNALHPSFTVVDPNYMAGCKAKGIQVNTWTVNDPAQAREAYALGVDAIITDDPARIRSALIGTDS